MLKLTIKGQGLNLEQEITMHQSGQIISFLSLSQSASEPSDEVNDFKKPSIVTSNTMLLNQGTTPGEELRNSEASTFPEKILVIANYITKINKSNNFSIEELKDILKEVGDYPTHFSRELKKTERLSYIYNKKEEGYVVTETGKLAIQNKFSEIRQDSRKTIKRRKTNGINRTTRLEIKEKVEKLPIITDLEEYGNYHNKNSKKSTKILWILEYAKANGIDSLNAKEIELISNRLGETIPQTSFSALNQNNKKSAYVYFSVSDSAYKIEKKGEDYLKSLLADTEKSKPA